MPEASNDSFGPVLFQAVLDQAELVFLPLLTRSQSCPHLAEIFVNVRQLFLGEPGTDAFLSGRSSLDFVHLGAYLLSQILN